MSKKPQLSADLVAVKGTAVPALDMPPRTGAMPVEPTNENAEDLVPLNFRVPASFRRAFKTFAAENDLKLNRLMQMCFEYYKSKKDI